jgi:hypothetical protein
MTTATKPTMRARIWMMRARLFFARASDPLISSRGMRMYQ